ncbi:MAG TPA: hypothetical protein VFW78_00290 [Bacteroidia bacterium]|nr:hypothetical protein [Bacteroidia bacterium]
MTTSNEFDNLTYNYELLPGGKKLNNKLLYVDDAAAAGNLTSGEDITDQSAGNYDYDDIGNLVQDNQEEIASIEWTVTGKIATITRTNGSTKPDLEFHYDPTGNRISKIVKPAGTSGTYGGTADPTAWTGTYYFRDATGNPMASYNEYSLSGQTFLDCKERYLYGSSRLGVDTEQVHMNITTTGTNFCRKSGVKHFEMTDHLGNVMAVVTDKKIPIDLNTQDNIIDGYLPDFVMAGDYYPYGQAMPGRTFNPTESKYGFQGWEKTDEIAGNGNHYTAEFIEYDPRIGPNGRWNPDPVFKAWISPYVVLGNNPIMYVDPNGDDWYEDADGNVRWDDTRGDVGSTMSYNDKDWTNIGATLTIETNSFIDKKNDIPVRGVEGDKLITTLSITGNYDDDGNFSGFTSSLDKYVGYTFGLIKGEKPTGTEFGITKNADGSWSGGFDIHTQVDWKEGIGMKLMFGNIVDVNQNVNYTVGANGMFSLNVGHGTFPSVTLDITNTSKIEYQFLEHSFILSHGIGMFSNTQLGIGMARQTESYYTNKEYLKKNSSFIRFSGYTAGDSELFSYPHLPKR